MFFLYVHGSAMHKTHKANERHFASGMNSVALGAQIHAYAIHDMYVNNTIAVNHLKKIVLINASEKEIVFHLALHTQQYVRGKITIPAAISSFAISPNGNQLICISQDGTLDTYDITHLAGGQIYAQSTIGLCKPLDKTQSIAYNSLGTYAAIASSNKKHVYIISTQFYLKNTHQLPHADAVTCVSFTPHNQLCITGCKDATITIWDATQLDKAILKLQVIKAHSKAVNTLACTNNFIVSGSDDAQVKLWDITNPMQPVELAHLIDHKDAITCVRFSSCESYILTCSKDSTLQIWDIEEPKAPICLNIIRTLGNFFYTAEFGPSNDYIITGSKHNRAYLLDLKNAHIEQDLTEAQYTISSRAITAGIDQLDNTDRAILATVPDNLNCYIEKYDKLKKKFTNDIAHLIIDYIGKSFAYNYRMPIIAQQKSNCVIA
jgi:WD40 repeat protein